LITVDDESIEKLKMKWPFPRHIYANLIKKIEAAHPRLIGLDLIFSGKDNPLDDLMLEEALKESGKVVLASYINSKRDYVTSLSEISAAAVGSGVVNKIVDADHIVRRSSLFYRDQKGMMVAWSWEIKLLFNLLKLNPSLYFLKPKGIAFTFLDGKKGNLFVPYDQEPNFRINYRYQLKNISQIPLWEALELPDLSAHCSGKIVLVGATSKVLHDYYETPLGMMAGIVVNINALGNMLKNDFLRAVPDWINVLWCGVFVFLAFCLSFGCGVVRGLMVMAGASVLCSGIFLFLFFANYRGDFLMPLLIGWAVFLSTSLYRYFRTTGENAELQTKSVTDPLTGLFNRRVLEKTIEEELDRLAKIKNVQVSDVTQKLSILMIDIDDFKKINDMYGHQFGDEVLKNVSFTLRENSRKDDVVTRFGGEEFCMVLRYTGPEEATSIANKIRSQIEARKYNFVNRISNFTVSIGVASIDAGHIIGFKGLIYAADKALYEAKAAGKNRVVGPVS
jgi:diguanylate cyclase (GGDEF)-like protein